MKGTPDDDLNIKEPPEGFWDSPVPMWIFLRETLRIIEVNQAAIDEYGFTRDEFRSLTILYLRPDEEVSQILRKTLHPSLAGPSNNEVWIHRRKDGTTFRVSISSQWLTWKGHPAELVTARTLPQ